jgi:outer membrane protein assembly factor BamE
VHTTYKTRFPAIRTLLLAGAMAISLTACGGNKWGFPYRADVQQGNWITAEQVAQLQTGMTREQVRFILGTPTLQDIFHANRWDYPYYQKPGYGAPQERKFTVWFENDQLVRWSGDEQPDRQPFEQSDTGMSSGGKTSSPSDADNATRNEDQPGGKEAKPAVGTGSTSSAPSPAEKRRPLINTTPSSPSVPGAPSPSRGTGQPLL